MKGKKLAIDILISIPIIFLYLLFIYKLIEMLTLKSKPDDKIKKTIILAFIFGLVSLAIGYYVFGKSGLKNRPMKISLIIGSLILIGHTLIYNWDKLQHDVRLIIIGITLGVGVVATYFLKST
jgi:hypothetical protein